MTDHPLYENIPAPVERTLEKAQAHSREILRRHAIPENAVVRDALRALNSLSGDCMTLFAVAEDGRLRGTVTDGDIRRALLAGVSLDDPVGNVMHRDFRHAGLTDDRYIKVAEARGLRIELLPVVEDGFVTDVLDLRHLRTSLPLDAVLMAGGKGERLRPLTLDTPKPLLHVGGKPIIDYNVAELAANGIRNIFVTVNYLKEKIIAHFEGSDNPKVVCVEEPRRLGTMGSLALVEGLANDNVLLMNSDLLTSLNFEEMFLHHQREGADLTMAAVPYTVSVPFAILHTEGLRIRGLEEKPTYNYFANAGVYILRRELIDEITPGEYLDAPDFIDHLIKTGRNVTYFPVNGTWIDIGSPDDFRYANEVMGNRLSTR